MATAYSISFTKHTRSCSALGLWGRWLNNEHTYKAACLQFSITDVDGHLTSTQELFFSTVCVRLTRSVFAHNYVTTRCWYFKFAAATVWRVMVALTKISFFAQYAQFCHGRSHICVYTGFKDLPLRDPAAAEALLYKDRSCCWLFSQKLTL